ncbi:hypothetical protein CANARDRAFT_5311 [[Candida] arabinofermentans NRRL YB-2248]|uniref:UEV domain-containing protein n=1 Tax=[Candida] arabinofermentans NRRL YB-2248 TaxID=983967 RepID=A0A1E4T8B9_9ASCO|nr:hypothetical protein CANARDRAFT_5311 [[Candida] arabinofermentans NRRL YB-2248]
MATHQLPEQLLQWLYRVLQPEYENPVICYQDISLILMCFNFLKVRTNVHNSVNGKTELLANIYGSVPLRKIPSAHPGSLNEDDDTIPIEIWIPFNYPKSPPIIYITNTRNNYRIQQSNYVDSNGKFYHPFLSDWFHMYGTDTSNEGTKPKDNRLLKLTETLIQCVKTYRPLVKVEEHHIPQSSVQTPPMPPIPPKPPIRHPLQQTTISDQSPSPLLVGSPKGGQSVVNSPPLPPPPKLTTSRIKPVPISDPTTKEVRERPSQPSPLLPPNPNRSLIMTSIIESLKRNIFLISNEIDNNTVRSSIAPLQNKLIQATENSINTENYIEFLLESLDKNNMILDNKMNETKQLIDWLNSNSQIFESFDEILIGETPVFNQLYHQVTLLESLEDLLYALERVHDASKITFDVYFKLGRQIAREICTCKMYIEKLADICSLER